MASGYDSPYARSPYNVSNRQNNIPHVSSKPNTAPSVKPTVSQPDAIAKPSRSDDAETQNNASSVSNNDTLQDGVIHSKTNDGNKKSIHQKAPVVKKKVTSNKIQIRDFPRDVMDIIRGIIPGGNSYVETLLAYIYVTSPVKFDLPPNVQAIADDYMQDDALTQVFKEIRLLREQIAHVEMTTYQTALASEYTLFNDLGLRKDTEHNPSDINYLEPGVEDMHIALEDGAKQLKKKDTIRHGRR